MEFFTDFKNKWKGVLFCLVVAVPAWFLGTQLEVVGAPVFAILLGMVLALVVPEGSRKPLAGGVKFTSKKILQYAVILLGFGMNLSEILAKGAQSLPIIVMTISTSLVIAFVLCRVMRVPSKIATLAALIFPTLGGMLGLTNEGFGLFAGTAVNDTSSVTAAASAWDSMHPGANVLESAAVVKLTRTLAIIPITLVLAFWQMHKAKKAGADAGNTFSLKKIFPFFVLFFVLASVITTVFALPATVTAPLKTLSKFFIVMAMAAVGFNTNIVDLVKKGGKPIALGFCCWVGIACMSLGMQHVLGIW